MSVILSLLAIGGAMVPQDNPNPFVPIDHPILHRKVAEVPVEEIRSAKIQETIDYMLSLSRGERTDVNKKIMVGLAAPQIGIDLRIIIVDLVTGADRKDIGHDLQAFINPKITWASDEMDRGREGCYSAGDFGGIVPRSVSVQISAYDREGNLVEKKFDGFTARIFQHEIDHLNGIRFPDRLEEGAELHLVLEEDYPEYREHWEHWHKTISLEEWKKLSE